MQQDDWLKKQRELYPHLPEETPQLSTHPISGEWQSSTYLKNQFWWGGGASSEAFEQLMDNEEYQWMGVIGFGPVQSFLGGGQRLRDWAVASWLCHYLAAVLIYEWEKRGGKILLPLYKNNALIRWLKGEEVDETFWQAELPNIVTGLFPQQPQWLANTKGVITQQWSRLLQALEKAAVKQYHLLNGIGWRVIHQDNRYLWSVYTEEKPIALDSIIEDIQSLHRSLDAQKVGRNWEGTWWGGRSSPSAGSLSVWHPGLKTVDTPGGTWGLPQDTLTQWWEAIATKEGYGLFSTDERLNSLELIKRLASVPDIIEVALEELWGMQPPPCPWGTFPDRTASAAAWVKNSITPTQWNEEVETINEYYLPSSTPKKWGMPSVDRLPQTYAHPRGLERRNIEDDNLEDWQENVPKSWESTIEWTVGWRGDGDKLGEWLAGKQYTKQGLSWRQCHPTPEIIAEYGLNIAAPQVPPQPRLVELPHILDISILLNYWSRLLYPLTEREHDGKVIFAGGDDFLLLGPLTEAVSLTSDLHRLWSGEKTNITEPLEPPVNGWVRHENQVYPIPGQTMSFSLGVVIAQRRIPQSLWHRGLNEAYKKAKNMGRDRVCVQVLFNSGQSLEWVCPWGLWDLLMTVEGKIHGKTELNTWEKLLFYLESTRLQQSTLPTVRKLVDTLWASVGLPLSWSLIEQHVSNHSDFNTELGDWQWWIDWISLRGFLARQQREREQWIKRVQRVRN